MTLDEIDELDELESKLETVVENYVWDILVRQNANTVKEAHFLADEIKEKIDFNIEDTIDGTVTEYCSYHEIYQKEE